MSNSSRFELDHEGLKRAVMPMMALWVIRDLGEKVALTGLEIAAETRGRLETLFPHSDSRIQTSVLYPMLEHFRSEKWVTRSDESNYVISSRGRETLKRWVSSLQKFSSQFSLNIEGDAQ